MVEGRPTPWNKPLSSHSNCPPWQLSQSMHEVVFCSVLSFSVISLVLLESQPSRILSKERWIHTRQKCTNILVDLPAKTSVALTPASWLAKLDRLLGNPTLRMSRICSKTLMFSCQMSCPDNWTDFLGNPKRRLTRLCPRCSCMVFQVDSLLWQQHQFLLCLDRQQQFFQTRMQDLGQNQNQKQTLSRGASVLWNCQMRIVSGVRHKNFQLWTFLWEPWILLESEALQISREISALSLKFLFEEKCPNYLHHSATFCCKARCSLQNPQNKEILVFWVAFLWWYKVK